MHDVSEQSCPIGITDWQAISRQTTTVMHRPVRGRQVVPKHIKLSNIHQLISIDNI